MVQDGTFCLILASNVQNVKKTCCCTKRISDMFSYTQSMKNMFLYVQIFRKE